MYKKLNEKSKNNPYLYPYRINGILSQNSYYISVNKGGKIRCEWVQVAYKSFIYVCGNYKYNGIYNNSNKYYI